MAKLSGATVVLLVVVPLLMYTGALFVGIQVGRVIERSPGSANLVSIRGIVRYFAKELWDNEWGRVGRDFAGRARALEYVHPVRTSPYIRTPPTQPKHQNAYTAYTRPTFGGQETSPNSRSYGTTKAPTQPKHQHAYTAYTRPTIGDRETSPNSRSYGNRSNHTVHTSPRGVISVGPWGGSGGQPFYMRGSAPQLLSITVYHSTVIHSMYCEYEQDGYGYQSSTWGRPSSFDSIAARATIDLYSDEHVTAVEGTVGRFRNVPDVVITSLTFRTSAGRTYGPYGGRRGHEKGTAETSFSVPATNGCIVGFWGRSGWLLDAIGVYIKPCP